MEENQRFMDEQNKSWEQKLAEAKAKMEEENKNKSAQDDVRTSGKPHLLNLNEDPQLDRKVAYAIEEGEELTCGRRKKGSDHKLQLGGTGIDTDHVKWVLQDDGTVKIIPLSEKAMPQIKVNGVALTSMDGLVLKANDRICIGPSAIFLFKNDSKLDDSCMKDPADDPISFEFASDEVYEKEQGKEKEAANAHKAEQEAANAAEMAEMKKKLEEEQAAKMAELKLKEDEVANLHAQAEAGNAEALKKEAELRASIEAERKANEDAGVQQQKRME